MLGNKKKADNRPYYQQYIAEGKEIWDAEKEKQLSKRESKKRKEYERLIKKMTVEEAHAFQDKREAKEILEHMKKRSKKAIKKDARKRMGMRSRVKSVVAGAVFGTAGYLGLSKVVHTEDREITRPLNESEYRNEVAKEYVRDGQKVELPDWDKNLVDWNSPDWYEQWLNALNLYKFPPVMENHKDTAVVDAILNGGDYSFVFRDLLKAAPSGDMGYNNTLYAMVGTPEERLEIYSYAFEQKWGMDPTTMNMADDALKTLGVYRDKGVDVVQEFIHDMALYRSMTKEYSDYRNVFEAGEFAPTEIRNFDGTYSEFLNVKEQEVFEQALGINDAAAFNGFGDFVLQVTYAAHNGDPLAQQVWYDYISINQAKLMCGHANREDNLFLATPSEVLPMFGITEADPMFQKYMELGSDEAIVARLLMIEHPGCNTFHADGSIHMTDAGTLTGEALTKFNEDLAFYQDLLTKGEGINALEYANLIYSMDPEIKQTDVVDIVNFTTEVIPGDDPVTHIGLPVTLLVAMGYIGMQKRSLHKAVIAEIEADIVKAMAKRDQERARKRTEEFFNKNTTLEDNADVKEDSTTVDDVTVKESSENTQIVQVENTVIEENVDVQMDTEQKGNTLVETKPQIDSDDVTDGDVSVTITQKDGTQITENVESDAIVEETGITR